MKKSSCKQPAVSLNDLFLHFKSLADTDAVEEIEGNACSTVTHSLFTELDIPITEVEIRQAVKNIKRGKAHGEDGMLNECFIEGLEYFIAPLLILFNNILKSGHFPASWSTALIIPIHKKGQLDDPNNFRGISLISCLSKIFTSISNKRLLDICINNDILSDAQFGFRLGVSTIDAVFALYSIISNTLSKKKRLYCCFVDFRKAFDYVDRASLWYKLSKIGLEGKLFSTIKSLYKQIKSRVVLHGQCSDFFVNNVGVLQGEILSPLLFSLFINDFEMDFIANGAHDYTFGELSLFLLMYADDLALFSESVEGLQNLLDNLERYAKKWKLTVNTDKTKIVIFRNGGIIRENESWIYNNISLKIVGSFC